MNNFNEYLESKGLSSHSMKLYLAEIKRFKVFLAEQGKTVASAEKKDILDYLTNENRPYFGTRPRQKEIANKTKQGILGKLNHLYTYLLMKGEVAQNITRFIKIRGAKQRNLRSLFTEDELLQLVDDYHYFSLEIERGILAKANQGKGSNHAIATRHKVTRLKNNIVLSLIAHQGLMIQEVQRLQKKDFDLSRAKIRVPKSRKSNARILALHASQMGLLLSYFNEQDETNFIPNRSKMARLNKHLQKMNSKFENLIQVRASVITNWLKVQGLRKAQYFAGHRYISSTEKFVHNDFEDLQKELDNCHPLR